MPVSSLSDMTSLTVTNQPLAKCGESMGLQKGFPPQHKVLTGPRWGDSVHFG